MLLQVDMQAGAVFEGDRQIGTNPRDLGHRLDYDVVGTSEVRSLTRWGVLRTAKSGRLATTPKLPSAPKPKHPPMPPGLSAYMRSVCACDMDVDQAFDLIERVGLERAHQLVKLRGPWALAHQAASNSMGPSRA